MTQKIKLTKEQILTALNKGKVSYHAIGGHITPFQARKRLLKMAEHIDELKEVDLSIAFDKRPQPIRISTHNPSTKNSALQNQR